LRFQSVTGYYVNGWYSLPVLDDYITDVLMRDLVGHDRRPASFLVYLWLAAEQSRSHGDVCLSYHEIAESIGISKSSVQAAMVWLVRRKLLVIRKRNATAVPHYRILMPWRSDPDSKPQPKSRSRLTTG
jgi:hypothetical protein